MAFASAIEPLRVANRLAGRELFGWTLPSPDGWPAAASGGFEIVAEGVVGTLPKVACLIVCAGFEPLRHARARLDRWLRRLVRFGTALGALDTGAFLLAHAGLLDGHRVTLH
jgi:AraC family transcriptional regulator, carnitine catabolism transcriptional activator